MAVVRPWRDEDFPDLAAEGLGHLNAGRVLALPTETFYALAADPFQEEALEQLYAVKGRSPAKPVLVLVSGPHMLPRLVREVPETARLLIRRFWPGPLTLILPARPELPPGLTGGTGTVGVRQPAVAATCRLLEAWDLPVTGTSANRAGKPPLRLAREVAKEFGDEVAFILDAGPCHGGLPSTILDVTTQPPTLVRTGALPAGRLLQVIPALQRKEHPDG